MAFGKPGFGGEPDADDAMRPAPVAAPSGKKGKKPFGKKGGFAKGGAPNRAFGGVKNFRGGKR